MRQRPLYVYYTSQAPAMSRLCRERHKSELPAGALPQSWARESSSTATVFHCDHALNQWKKQLALGISPFPPAIAMPKPFFVI